MLRLKTTAHIHVVCTSFTLSKSTHRLWWWLLLSDVTWSGAWYRNSLYRDLAAPGLDLACGRTKHLRAFNNVLHARGSLMLENSPFLFFVFCFVFQRRCVWIPWSRTLTAATAPTPVTLSWAMSGSGRSPRSYPEETGQPNPTCQKWYLFSHITQTWTTDRTQIFFTAFVSPC